MSNRRQQLDDLADQLALMKAQQLVNAASARTVQAQLVDVMCRGADQQCLDSMRRQLGIMKGCQRRLAATVEGIERSLAAAEHWNREIEREEAGA